MHFRFPYIGANLCKSSLQPGISEHCDTTDTGWRLVYHVVCLFTPPAFAGYFFQPNHRGRAQAE